MRQYIVIQLIVYNSNEPTKREASASLVFCQTLSNSSSVRFSASSAEALS